MNKNPTKDQLRGLLAACDDDSAHHMLWVSKDGTVSITPVPEDLTPVGLEEVIGDDMKFRLETFQIRNGYVGKEASKDDNFVNELFEGIQKSWAVGAEGYVDDWACPPISKRK